MPGHLRELARIDRDILLEVDGEVTIRSVLDKLELEYPMLRGTIRDQITLQRRPFVRFFACREDHSLEPMDTPLPESVARGDEVLRIVGAMAGG